jgi:hypothetical protein
MLAAAQHGNHVENGNGDFSGRRVRIMRGDDYGL